MLARNRGSCSHFGSNEPLVRVMTRSWRSKSLLGILAIVALAACGEEPEQGIARGEAIFDSCAPCHGDGGEGNQSLGAPAIAGLPLWYVENQLQSFKNGWRGSAPFDTVGIRMKSMAITLRLEGDLESVAEFVASLPPAVPDDVLAGEAQVGQGGFGLCAACHGQAAEGNEALGAPPLAGMSDWYMVRQLEKFKSGWRGAHPGDARGALMRVNAMSLDPAAMLDVVAYIETLR